MAENIYIYHHLGLGDAIICNAIIRSYAEKYDKVFVFSKPRNTKNTLWMYRDNPRIKIISMEDFEIKQFMKIGSSNKYLIVGHEELFKILDKGLETFDQIFYKMSNIPFEDKWNKFYFERDLEKEKNAFYNKLGLKDDEQFLFVHDDPERGRHFKKEFIKKGVKVIHPTKHKDIGIFDFIYTIEKAQEVHVMNSSFSCLIDTMQIKTNKLFYHEYARTDMGNNPNHKLKLNWIILK